MKIERLLAAIMATVIITLSLSACGSSVEDEVDSAPLEPQIITASVGESVSTMFFELTVNSAQSADTYSDFIPGDENYKIVVINVTYTNTTTSDIEMYDSDFVLLLNDAGTETAYVYDAFTDEMMPGSETLKPGQAATYDLLFCVPKETSSFIMMYEEVYSQEGQQKVTGDKYHINISV